MLSALHLLLSVEMTPLPVPVLDRLGFKSIRSAPYVKAMSGGITIAKARYANDHQETLTVDVSWTSSREATNLYPHAFGSRDHLEHMKESFTVFPFSESSPSGMPPEACLIYHERGGNSISVPMQARNAKVNVVFVSKVGTTSGGFADPKPLDYQTKSALVERIARHTLANAAGLRLDDAGTGSLAGRSVKKAKCRRSDRIFGRVDEWTDGEGWSFAEDQFYGLINMKKGAKWAVLPLGADQIKVNGVWKEMGDSAAFFKGKLYLPEAGLKHLKDAG